MTNARIQAVQYQSSSSISCLGIHILNSAVRTMPCHSLVIQGRALEEFLTKHNFLERKVFAAFQNIFHKELLNLIGVENQNVPLALRNAMRAKLKEYSIEDRNIFVHDTKTK